MTTEATVAPPSPPGPLLAATRHAPPPRPAHAHPCPPARVRPPVPPVSPESPVSSVSPRVAAGAVLLHKVAEDDHLLDFQVDHVVDPYGMPHIWQYFGNTHAS